MDCRIVNRTDLASDVRGLVPDTIERVIFQDYTRCSMGELLLRELLGQELKVPQNSVFLVSLNPGGILVLGPGESIRDKIPAPPEKIFHVDQEKGVVSEFGGGSMMKIMK